VGERVLRQRRDRRAILLPLFWERRSIEFTGGERRLAALHASARHGAPFLALERAPASFCNRP
jgi:hypothetical protein